MAAPTIVRSTDSAAVAASAILTGNAGSLIAVLDHALVTRLGWTKDFTATNKGVYRPSAGVRHYLDVDDSGPDATALGRNARLRGYEAATAVGTGTGPFPTVAQSATPVYVKSTATGTTARPWIVIGDSRTFYLFSEAAGADPPNLSAHTWTDGFGFGEILSAVTGDGYRTIMCWASNTTTAAAAQFPFQSPGVSGATGGTVPQSMPRSYLGTGGAEWCQPFGNLWNTHTSFPYGQATTVLFPNSNDGGLYMGSIGIGGRGGGTTAAGTTYIRGRMRGLYSPVHYLTAMNDQDTFSGVGEFAGKTFLALQVAGTRGQALVVETTDWAFSS